MPDSPSSAARKGGNTVAIVTPEGLASTAEGRARRALFSVREMWAALAVGVIWLAVLVDALFGPDIVTSNASGYARIPSAVVLAFFAFLATWVIARHGFGHRDND
jgi:hypothetical protein